MNNASPKDKRTILKDAKNMQYLLSMSNYEHIALQALKPFDPYNLSLKIVEVYTPATNLLYNYYRLAISSHENQGVTDVIGRAYRGLVFDTNSGCFLGLFSLASMSIMFPTISSMCGWDNKIPLEGYPKVRNAYEYERKRSLLKLSRCLPIYEFGGLLGGKLLVLAAMSKEIVRHFEVKYSLPFVSVMWSTLHGKSSQYSRLENNNIRLIALEDYDGRQRGVYYGEYRRDSVKFLSGAIDKPGKIVSPDFSSVVSSWQERWYLPRLKSKGVVGMITPNKEAYKLSTRLLTTNGRGYNNESSHR